jgi:hypothetical protein
MIMPGLGGKELSKGHVKDTVNLLNYIKPEWVTFIGLKVEPKTPYARWIKREEEKKKNRSLTPREVVEQTAQMIEGLDFQTTIGLHGNDIHTYGYNPVTIGSVKVDGWYDSEKVAEAIRKKAKKIAKIN